jgi:hypothetical protein
MEANHQAEIEISRKGGFGSSDAKLFFKLGSKGLESLNNTDKKRISVAKGLIEYKPIPQTESMLRGHEFEAWYAKKNKKLDRETKISKTIAKNFNTFFHADFTTLVNDRHEFNVIELKCVQHPETADEEYKEQLQWQHMISDCTQLILQICYSGCADFKDGLLEQIVIQPNENIINTLKKGIQLLDEAWDTIDLTIGEEWDESDLMFFEREQMQIFSNYLSEIKQLENEAEKHRESIKQMMIDNGIRSIKSDFYSVTLIPESTTNTFDKKKLLADHPEINESDYLKSSQKKSYIKVTLK